MRDKAPVPVPNQEGLLGTHGWKDGRAWRHDYKLGVKVWDEGIPPSAHTPGPWVAEEAGFGGSVQNVTTYQTGKGTEIVCSLSGKGYDVNAANARLIAAAPDMLAALKAMVDYAEGRREGINPMRHREQALNGAHAAIARAEGR